VGAKADALELMQCFETRTRFFGPIEPQRPGDKTGAGSQVGPE
jgi:hypothetical protein